MKLQTGQLYTLSRIDDAPVYMYTNIKCKYKGSSRLSKEDEILLLGDKFSFEAGSGHLYKVLTRSGKIGYVYHSELNQLFFTPVNHI